MTINLKKLKISNNLELKPEPESEPLKNGVAPQHCRRQDKFKQEGLNKYAYELCIRFKKKYWLLWGMGIVSRGGGSKFLLRTSEGYLEWYFYTKVLNSCRLVKQCNKNTLTKMINWSQINVNAMNWILWKFGINIM